MGNEQSAAGGVASGESGKDDRSINKGDHPPPLPLIVEAEQAQIKRHFPHAKRLYLSALESLIFYTGAESIETARCRVKVGEMCIQEKKFDEALTHLRLALNQLETLRKDVSPRGTPTPQEVKKLMGDVAFCEYNLAQKEARGTQAFNKLSIAALQKFQAISQLNKHEAENASGGVSYVTDLVTEDFTARNEGRVVIPETGGDAMELALMGAQGHSELVRASDGMTLAREAEAHVNEVNELAAETSDGFGSQTRAPPQQSHLQVPSLQVGGDGSRLPTPSQGAGLSRRGGLQKRTDTRQHQTATPEMAAIRRHGGDNSCGASSQSDCNLIVASLYANTNNPVEARKVLSSTASTQRQRKVPINATQRLAVGLDEQMRQLNALRLIQRGLLRILRRIRLRHIFRRQRELVEEWEATVRDQIYEFEDDICYNWTGMEGDARDAQLEEEALRFARIKDELDDLMAVMGLEYEDLGAEADIAFDAIMADYQEFLADVEFQQQYDPEHWQRCIDQALVNEESDRKKIRLREQDEWDAMMQMMKISAMAAKRKEDERHAAYARVRKEIFDGCDADADAIRKQEQKEWIDLMNAHFEVLIADLIEQERKARLKVADLPYQREFWRTMADDEADERAEIQVRDQQRARALKLASEKLELEFMDELERLRQEEQEAWNKMMRQFKKDFVQAQKKEEEGKKRQEVKEKLVERMKAKTKVKAQRDLQLAQLLMEKAGEMTDLVDGERIAREIVFMKRRRSTKLPLSMEDLEILQRHFKHADQDESNDIDREEFARYCATVPKTKLTRKQADELFDILDTDGNGVLSFEEFCYIYDHMEDILTRPNPALARRKSSVSVPPPEESPPEFVPESLTPPDEPVAPPPTKARRRSMRTAAVAQTADPDAFLLEDEPVTAHVEEEDTTPASSVPVSALMGTPANVAPTPNDPAMRRKSQPRRQSTAADTQAMLPDDEPFVTAVDTDADSAPALVTQVRRRSFAVMPSAVTEAPPEEKSPLPVADQQQQRRRSSTKPRKTSAAPDVDAALPEEDVAMSIAEENLDSLSPGAAKGTLVNEDTSTPAANAITATRKRSLPRSRKTSTSEDVEAAIPDDSINPQVIEETDSIPLQPTRRRRSDQKTSSDTPPSATPNASPTTFAPPSAIPKPSDNVQHGAANAEVQSPSAMARQRSTGRGRRTGGSGAVVDDVQTALPEDSVREIVDDGLAAMPTRRRSVVTKARQGGGSTQDADVALPDEPAREEVQDHAELQSPSAMARQRSTGRGRRTGGSGAVVDDVPAALSDEAVGGILEKGAVGGDAERVRASTTARRTESDQRHTTGSKRRGSGREEDVDTALIDDETGQEFISEDVGDDGLSPSHHRHHRPSAGADALGSLAANDAFSPLGPRLQSISSSGALTGNGSPSTSFEAQPAALHASPTPPQQTPSGKEFGPRAVSSVGQVSQEAGGGPRRASKSAPKDNERDAETRRVKENKLRADCDLMMKRLFVRLHRSKAFSMTPEDVQLIRELFEFGDDSNNGILSRAEFLRIFDTVIRPPTMNANEAAALFDEADDDRTGALNLREFVKVFRLMLAREAEKQSPALADAIRESAFVRKGRTKEAVYREFRESLGALCGPLHSHVEENLSFDPEFVHSVTDWANLRDFVAAHPSLLGAAAVGQMEAALQKRVQHTTNTVLGTSAGAADDTQFTSVSTQDSPAHESASPQLSSVSDSAASPAQRRKRSVTRKGSVAFSEGSVLDDSEARAIEEEFQTLRRDRKSNREHRLLWDRTAHPPWGLPAADEIKNDANCVLMMQSNSQEELLNAVKQLAEKKQAESEHIFAQFPYLDPLPHGVPLAELQLPSNEAFMALLNSSGIPEQERHGKLNNLVHDLARARHRALATFGDREKDFSEEILLATAGDKLRQKLSRRASRTVSDSDSDDDDAARRQRTMEDREAELQRRRQEVAQAKEEEARRLAESEEALRRQRESDVQDLKRHNQRLRQKATNKAEAEALVKRCRIRASKNGAEEVEFDVRDLEVIKAQFDFCDEDETGGISKQKFYEFYDDTCSGIRMLQKKEVDDLFRMHCSDGTEMNFMEFVEAYKDVAGREIEKKTSRPAMNRRGTSVAQLKTAPSMVPKKPDAPPRSVPSMRQKK